MNDFRKMIQSFIIFIKMESRIVKDIPSRRDIAWDSIRLDIIYVIFYLSRNIIEFFSLTKKKDPKSLVVF